MERPASFPMSDTADTYDALPLDHTAHTLNTPLLSYNAAAPTPTTATFPDEPIKMDERMISGLGRSLSGSELRSSALERARKRGSITPQMSAHSSFTPIPFTTTFSVILLLYMVLLAVACEIVVHFSQKDHGFNVDGLQQRFGGSEKYLWTTALVAFSVTVSAAWSYFAYWLKVSQPFIDLAQGQATADKTLLLDYASDSNWLILWTSVRRRHWLTFLAALLCVVTYAVSPLASAMFALRQINLPGLPVTSIALAQIGIGEDVATGVAQLASAGYAISAVEANTSWPPFLDDINGALIPWEVPTSWGTNGSAFTNTSAIRSASNCLPATGTATTTSSGRTVNLDAGTCQSGTVQINPENATGLQFYVLPVACSSGYTESDSQFQPVAFISLNLDDDTTAVAVCFPSLQVLPVLAGIDLATLNIIQSVVTGPADNSTLLAQAPFLGRALNGVAVNASAPSLPSVNARILATQILLAATVQKFLAITPGTDLTAAANNVYATFLASLAPVAYLQPASVNTSAILYATVSRLWVTPAVAHSLAVIFLILAILGAYVMRAHARLRRRAGVSLPHDPGTIASSVALAGQASGLISAKDDYRLMEEVLGHHKYSLDKNLGNIVVMDATDQ